MSKDKISDYSATANSNTDIAGINIDEGCAPSGINDAIRTLMKQLKDFQQGTNGDSFNGPHNGTVGATTPAAGTFTTLTTSSTINGLTVGKGAGAISTNTAVGASALATNSTGAYNTAFGRLALRDNTATGNTAVGSNALLVNTTGVSNTAIGGVDGASVFNVLERNTTGSYNTAVGGGALSANTTASNNTAVGYQAGYSNQTGTGNVYIGQSAGYLATSSTNTFVGAGAGQAMTSGARNTFVGNSAGYNTTGGVNTFVGVSALSAAGAEVTTGTKNTIIGGFSGNQGGLDIRTASNYIVLSDGDGNPRLWHSGSFLACPTVYSVTTASTPNVFVDSFGSIIRGGVSALKYKQDIRDLEEIDINLIRAVRYKSKCEIDDQTKDYFGVIADQVAETGIEELVTRSADGEVEGFQYERLTVVLLKKLQVLEAKLTALENK